MPSPSPQDEFLQEYEEEMAQVLENMGTYYEERDPYGNSEGKNHSLNQSASAGSSGHAETFPSTNNLGDQMEPVPSMNETLEEEAHAYETLWDENKPEVTIPLESPEEEAHADETMEDENQPGDIVLIESPEEGPCERRP